MKIKKAETCLMVFAFFAAVLISSSTTAAEREDTAHLVLKKTISARDRGPVYVVRKGDHLTGILRRELDAGPAEMGWMLKEVKRRNPGLKNVDVIEPGRKLSLPVVAPPEGYQIYRVKKGDFLARILEKNLGLKGRDLARALTDVKKQNPTIRDINLIFPGQRIFIPLVSSPGREKAEESARLPEPAAVLPELKPVLLTEKERALVRRVVEQTGGLVLTDGNYYIPLSAEDQVTIDCATVPVVELDDGSRILVDFESRVPPDLKERIQRVWKNYTVIQDSGGVGALPALERIFKASRNYSFRKTADYADVGAEPKIRLLLDWVLFKKESAFTGIALRESPSAAMPAALSRYAERNGISVLEMTDGLDVVRDEAPPGPPSDVPALKSETTAELVDSVITTLGLTASRDAWVKVAEAGAPAKVVSAKVDFLVERPGKEGAVIALRELPAPFQESLKRKGMDVVMVKWDDEKKAVIEKTLTALGYPFNSDTFDFSGPGGKDGKPRWVIRIPATRVNLAEGELFLTPSALDGDIYSYVNATWGTKLIRY
ncbi:MAG TPA: LysM peptidoglycan-binding domain-containing protein [Syntrophales bacterium]|mgnify:CR=1 FL=1|nr:LysM peptidoglycan-binding domain-containing protein [Syntrophales bacterium]HOX94709.1 LysM peptidoglycan-binding domain-containing protein [Syntrophales bacterium]HPI58120.1 LysM peptidoglycan-binding domain-containing protein [Syntrophales bacterium]HPN24655.1 LysM peptidoglycan-binding domain-containing protein [Syntrophales bacterium]HQM28960.1 LysM peptidoglycan-binding domain-containing protein [Syntrophales bacterium]